MYKGNNSDGLRNIARELRSFVGHGPVTLLPVENGGLALYTAFEKELRSNGIGSVCYVLKNSTETTGTAPKLYSEDSRDNYREIVSVHSLSSRKPVPLKYLRNVIRRKNGTALIIDDGIMHGRTLAGAEKHVIDLYDIYGIEDGGLFTFAGDDRKGYVAHFALSRDYDDPMDHHEMLRTQLPESYFVYQNDGRIRLIADTPSIHRPVLNEVETVRVKRYNEPLNISL